MTAKILFVISAAIVLAAAGRDAAAVLIQMGDGTGNTTAPADDPGFANVGYSSNGIGTAIYLGEGWVLTAGHVGGGGIVLSSGTYFEQAGTGFSLANDTVGESTYTDLYMYKLQTTPVGLPTLSIASTAPTPGLDVTMIGAGLNRGAFTKWLINTSTTPNVWTETTGTAADAAGYKTGAGRAVRWGTNDVETSNFWERSYFGPGPNDFTSVRAFTTDFDFAEDSTEAQAVLRDSGGAVFAKQGSQWQLTGVIYAVDGFPDQPSPVFNAVFGNFTYMADLSHYRSQIVAAVPEPSAAVLAACGAAGLFIARSRRPRRPGHGTARTKGERPPTAPRIKARSA